MTSGIYRRAAPALGVALFYAVPTLASEYSLAYSVQNMVQYTENVNLSVNTPRDISEVTLRLPAQLAIDSGQLRSSLGAEISSSKYDESGYNSDDQLLEGKTDYRFERGSIGGGAGLKRFSTRESEFLDTGVIGLSASRVEVAYTDGNFNYSFTEKNGFTSNVSYRQTSYDSPRYRNNEFINGLAGWNHQWSEMTTLNLSATANHFENESDGRQLQVTSQGYGLQIGASRTLSEQFNTALSGGWTSVDTEYSSNLPTTRPDDNSTSYTVNGSMNYEEERYRVSARLVRRANPSGNGYLLINDTLNIVYEYKFSERTQFVLTLVAGASGALDEEINNDRTFGRSRLELKYRFTKNWVIGGLYGYSYQDREREAESVDSNAFKISLSYAPQRIIWSR